MVFYAEKVEAIANWSTFTLFTFTRLSTRKGARRGEPGMCWQNRCRRTKSYSSEFICNFRRRLAVANIKGNAGIYRKFLQSCFPGANAAVARQ